jgi:hypothetical protein
MTKNNLRKRILQIDRCSICGYVERKELLDIDHKIPQCMNGPDENWNTWPICLKCHRIKCINEYDWLPKTEKLCFSCNKIKSKFFINSFWCNDCLQLSLNVRVINLECIIKNLHKKFMLKESF